MMAHSATMLLWCSSPSTRPRKHRLLRHCQPSLVWCLDNASLKNCHPCILCPKSFCALTPVPPVGGPRSVGQHNGASSVRPASTKKDQSNCLDLQLSRVPPVSNHGVACYGNIRKKISSILQKDQSRSMDDNRWSLRDQEMFGVGHFHRRRKNQDQRRNVKLVRVST
jgi:hypothetical protein